MLVKGIVLNELAPVDHYQNISVFQVPLLKATYVHTKNLFV